MELYASRFETRRYAGYLGATSEFTCVVPPELRLG
jgi:hypothetical protein